MKNIDGAKNALMRNKWLGVTLKVIKRFFKDDCPTLGAAISFFAAFSLLPLLLLIISAFGFLLAAGFPSAISFKSEFLRLTAAFSPEIASFLEVGIETATSARKLMGAAGVIVLFFAGAVFFEQISLALDKIWGVSRNRSFFKRKFISWIAFLAVILILFFFTVVKLLLGALIGQLSEAIGHYAWLDAVYAYSYLLFAFVALTILYRFLPAAKVSWRNSVKGGLVATVFLSLLNWIFAWYMGKIDLASLYGPVGVSMLFLLWIYLFSLALLLGGEVTAVLDELD